MEIYLQVLKLPSNKTKHMDYLCLLFLVLNLPYKFFNKSVFLVFVIGLEDDMSRFSFEPPAYGKEEHKYCLYYEIDAHLSHKIVKWFNQDYWLES